MREIAKYLFLLSALLLGQCRSPLDIDIQDSKSLVAVESFINPAGKLYVYINKISPIGKLSQAIDMESTSVDLYTDGKVYNLEKLPYNGFSELTFSHLEATWTEKTQYELRINIKNLEPIIAKTNIPKAVKLDMFDLFEANRNAGSTQSVKTKVTWQNDAASSNYYHLIFYKANYIIGIDGKPVLNTQKPIEYLNMSEIEFQGNENFINLTHEPGVLITSSDTTINNVSLSCLLKTQETINNSDSFFQIYAELRTVSKEYYEFHKSVYNQLKNSDFLKNADPVPSYSNVSNAFGVFAGYSKFSKEKQF